MTTAVGPVPKFTDEQRRALETRGVSIALSAGAGCGKTFVLTQRYLGHFAARAKDGEPSDPAGVGAEAIGQLVAITFTNAAAREMRDRIRRACYERLKEADEEEADTWSAIIRSLDSARISTIDSFCSTLLRSHAVEAGLDPQFTLLEAAQSGTLISEFTDDVLRASLSAQDPATLDLTEQFGLETLQEILRLLAGHRDAMQLDAWLNRKPAEQVACWAEFHRDQVVPSVMRRVVESESARQLRAFLAATVPCEPSVQAQRLSLLEIMQAWQAGKTIGGDPSADLDTLRDNAKIKKRSPATWPSPADYETFRDVCKELRERVIDKVSKALAFDAAAALPAAEAGLRVLPLAVKVVQRYEREKRETAALDFRDLLARAHALLTSPQQTALRRRVSDQIQLLMVDEFQDTDPVQVELIAALCGDGLQTGKLFFVGDYKQSIYRFRGADPHVFRQLRASVPPAGRLPLTLNFRSQPAILNFVNALFADVLGGNTQGGNTPSSSIQEGGYEPLRPHRQQVSSGPAIEFLWALPDEPSDVKETADDLRRREADWIARRLRGMIESQTPIVWDAAAAKLGTPAARAVRPGDVAILFRALSDVAYYEEALRRHGLDYYLVGGHAFYAQQEIFDLANLLRAIAYPADAISLVGALRSPLFCLADESLLWLAQKSGDLTIGLFADDYPPELTGDQRQRVLHAARTIQSLRSRKDSSTIVELIEEALAATGYDALLLAEFLGQRKLANLRKLIDQARRFEQGGRFGLADFILELSGHVAEQPKEALAATHASDTDVIRLMSIHQSKGLEFPVVVIADIDRSVQTRSAPAEFSAMLGPLVRLPAPDDQSPPVGGYDLFNSLATEEDLAEAYRLLYVAATRAGDHLILSAGMPDMDKAQGPWAKLLRGRFDAETGNYLGPSLPADKVPQVNVIRERPSCGAAIGPPRRTDWQAIIDQAHELALANPASQQPLVDAVPVAASDRLEFSFSRLHGHMHARVRSAEQTDATETDSQTLDEDLPEGATKPTRASREAIDARSLGTLVHAVLAAIRLGEPVDVPALVGRHAEQQGGTSDNERKLAAKLVEKFLKSGRAQQLAAAKSDLVELEFLLAWPPGGGGSDRLQLTGFIDRLYEDKHGEWHVLDFKTNQVDASTLSDVAANYELQMYVYALAAEQALGRPPKSLTLHMLRTGDEVAIAWNDPARAKVRYMVDEAIARLREPAASRLGVPPRS